MNRKQRQSIFYRIMPMAFGIIGLFTNALSQRNITYRSHMPYIGTLANVWGYHDAANNREYALVGVEFGLSIVDVTNPDKPKEIFFINGDTSLWQEPKTWNQYVYMTNEKGDKGLMIVDMSNLPTSVNVAFWKGTPSYEYRGRSHTCFIDENGILYLNGSQVHHGTALFDLKPNPLNPLFLGVYNTHYVHDCFARGDTLWTSEIINGFVSVLNVKDKSNPVLMQRFQTPYTFTHNCWLSDDGKFLFTTDEKPYASVASYDVSDLENITLLDEYRHSWHDSLIPHNTYITSDSFLYTSYYRAGVTIVDAHKPDNLVEIGHYDTSPFGNSGGFEGCWGVYPFLPSGTILASDREEGLFVLTPQLKRACYLEGKVTNQQGEPLPGTVVSIVGSNTLKSTNFLGNYKTGTGDAGKYDVRVYDPSNRCFTKIIKDVEMKSGEVSLLNVQLNCIATGFTEAENDWAYVYPSSFANQTTLFLNGNQSGVQVEVFDVSGSKLISETTSYTRFTFGENLASGIYLIRLKHENAQRVLRMIKTH